MVARVVVAIGIAAAMAGGVLAFSFAWPSPDSLQHDPAESQVVTSPTDYSYLESSTRNGSHIHDYWNGQNELLVYDDDVTYQGFLTEDEGRFVTLTPPDGAMVIPGTRWINVTMHATTTVVGEIDYAFYYRAANQETNETPIAPEEELSLPVVEEMNDLPHSGVTQWSFALVLYSSPSTTPDWADAEFSVVITIGKKPGPLPVAPPHPDHWNGADSLLRFEERGALDSVLGTGSEQPPMQPQSQLIPPLTATVVVRFDYNSSTDPNLHYRPELSWKGADRKQGMEELHAPPANSAYRQQGGFAEWTIDVEPRMWDSFYASNSSWNFGIDWVRTEAAVVEVPFGPVWMDGDYQLVITAHRGSP